MNTHWPSIEDRSPPNHPGKHAQREYGARSLRSALANRRRSEHFSGHTGADPVGRIALL
jgi:hypothetical protein